MSYAVTIYRLGMPYAVGARARVRGLMRVYYYTHLVILILKVIIQICVYTYTRKIIPNVFGLAILITMPRTFVYTAKCLFIARHTCNDTSITHTHALTHMFRVINNNVKWYGKKKNKKNSFYVYYSVFRRVCTHTHTEYT